MTFGRLLPLVAVFAVGLVVGRYGLAPKGSPTGERPVGDVGVKPVSAFEPAENVAGRVDLVSLVKSAGMDSDELAFAQRYGQLGGLSVDELEALLAEIALADSKTLKGDRKELEDAVILRLMEISPEKAWFALSQSRPGDSPETVDRRTGEWVRRVFERLAKEDLEAGMRLAATARDSRGYAIEALLDGAGGDNFLELITWAKSVDPGFARFDDAVSEFTNPDSYSYYFPDNRIFSRWAQSDPEAAKAYVLGLEGREERLQGLSGIAEGLVLRDPDAAVAFINSLQRSEERSAAWYRAMGIMASSRPADAARLYDQLPDGRIKIAALNALAGSWIRSDRAAATAWMVSLPEGQMRQRACKAAADMLESRDPAAAIALADQLTGVGSRTGMLRQIVSRWLQRDVSGAIGWIGAHEDGALRADLLKTALPNYASTDPEQAASYFRELEAMGDVAGLADVAATIGRVMEYHDADRGLAWAKGLTDPTAREAALAAVVESIARDDPQRGKALAEAGLVQGGDALRGVAQNLIASDPDAGFAWAAQRLDDEQLWSVTSRALHSIAGRSPEEASRQLLAAAGYLEPETWNRLRNQAEMIANNWGRHDLHAALAWTETLPEGDVQFAAAMPLIEQWVFSDPMAASQWIAELPPGALQHQGAVKLSKAILDEDPESAFMWSQGLSDGYRMSLMGASLQKWAEIDSEAARAAAVAVEVTEEDRETLLRAIEGGD